MTLHKCNKCGLDLQEEQFNLVKRRNGKYTLNTRCKSCVKIGNKIRYLERHQFYLDNARRWRKNLREEVLTHYGGICACFGCGESRSEFLTFDHINGRKEEHRRQKNNSSGFSGFRLLKWIIKKHFPDDIQVLCYNCNCSKGFLGRCPHTEELQDADRNAQQQSREQILFELQIA